MTKVYLIGAGPGDEELLTLKGKRVLEKCTAVLYDRLANSSLLKYLKDDCKIYYCGKKPGCHYKSQPEINDMLVELVRQGHIVGRIKGGDPYVFGRGGEEALRLQEENIEFEVIPGITSVLAVLNYAGIPVTHRGTAQSFHVFTGKSAEELNVSWELVAKLNGTLLFLMGLENIEDITKQLILNGKEPKCSCAVVMKGTTSKQQKVIGTLEDIAGKVRAAGLKSPCIIAIGTVVDLNKQLCWYENKPLFGKNICITRSIEQSEEIRGKLLDLGAEVTSINTIRIKDCSSVLGNYQEKLPMYDYIVLTSVNAVKLFFKYLRDKDYDIRNLKGEFCAIGAVTESAIKEKGLIPKVVPVEFVAEALLEEMKKYIKVGDKILIPRSSGARTYLVDELRKLGCFVDEVPIYEIEEGLLQDKSIFLDVDIAIFTSPSTVRNLIAMVGLENIKEKECIAIGPITSIELRENGIKHVTCDEYTTDGIIKKLLEWKVAKS